jgi:hypothetical protein
MRKQVLIAGLGLAMLLLAGVADAADRVKSQQITARSAGGNVPSAMLAEMGLEGMEVLSDQQGTEVRGTGFFFFYVGFHHPFYFHPFFPHHHHPFFFHHHGFHHPFFYPYVW